ncbi:hypothetical protein [Piscirickettsia litoralis]|uniref:Secreted protein n=1 Tax=Piscirickettsia litoralis TaxID=1891921 RepID=A0ABX3A000_9GAMM|nr:hypothetical protein [Piscirickettsia litoralis]ODN41805.1 hypothetical protein BGC07_00930 [Piscirickettsia litoralis]
MLRVTLLCLFLIVFTIAKSSANPQIDVIALKVGQQIGKKIREECHSLSTDQVADDLPSQTDKERAWKIYSNSYEHCMTEALQIMKKDLSTIDVQVMKSNG